MSKYCVSVNYKIGNSYNGKKTAFKFFSVVYSCERVQRMKTIRIDLIVGPIIVV